MGVRVLTIACVTALTHAVRVSLCSSPLRARASAVYELCNSLKLPVREEVSAHAAKINYADERHI